MNFFKFLFGSKWKSKNSTTPSKIAADRVNSPENVASLPRLVREDPDVSIRMAALNRLDDFEVYRERSIVDSDTNLRRHARERYLASFADNKIPLEQRIRQLVALEPNEIERIAQTATETELRLAALQRVKRQSIFIDRAINDSDISVRRFALEHVTDPPALARIAEKTRKTDKTISRLARGKLEAMQIAAGDQTAIAQRAQTLCEQIETLVRNPGNDLTTQLATFNQIWNELGTAIPNDLANRYLGARDLLERYLSPPTSSSSIAEITSEQENKTETTDSSTHLAPIVETSASLTAEVEIKKTEAISLSSSVEKEEQRAQVLEEKQQERERLHAAQEQLSSLLTFFDLALEKGDIRLARQQNTQIEILKQQLAGNILKNTISLLEESEKKYAELIRWQRWSNNQRRIQLCNEIEELIGSGLHPDALAAKIRDARNEWRQLDHAEGVEQNTASTPTLGLTKRFKAICHRAIKPAQPYFEKRDELRRSHTEQIEALIGRYKAISLDSTDWKAMRQLRTEVATALRDVNRIDPRVRIELTKQLKDAMTESGIRLVTHEEDVEKAKSQLIKQAEILIQSDDVSAAVRTVPELQKRWKAAGNGRRRADQSQWETFHQACNAVFLKQTALREQRTAEITARRTQAEALIQEINALPTQFNQEATPILRRLKEIESQWQTLSVEDRDLKNQFRSVRETVIQACEKYQREERLSRYKAALTKYQLLREVEYGQISFEKAAVQWRELIASSSSLEEPIKARFDALESTSANTHNTIDDQRNIIESARQLLIELEILAQIESPATERQLRMDHQVARLTDRLRDKQNNPIEEDFTNVLRAWFLLPAISTDISKIFNVRFDNACSAIMKSLP